MFLHGFSTSEPGMGSVVGSSVNLGFQLISFQTQFRLPLKADGLPKNGYSKNMGEWQENSDLASGKQTLCELENGDLLRGYLSMNNGDVP